MIKATFLSILLCLGFIFAFSQPVMAACPPDCPTGEKQTTSNTGTTVQLSDPLQLNGKEGAPQELIGRVISAALGIIGSLALIMFIYGGFMWMLSGGNEKMIDKGKTTLIWAALGLVIVFMSYAIVTFVINTATNSAG